MKNPFVLVPYENKVLFCDRESETENILDDLLNGVNVTLISPRRLGKTGLIYRIFEELEKKEPSVIKCYCDIYSASNIEDFIKLLAEAVVKNVQDRSILKKFFSAFGGVRPLLSYDSISGTPQVTITYQNDKQKETSLKEIFDFLGKQKKKIVVAIDEFQEIRNFKDVNMEALLRTYIQPLKNVSFIFCGSKKHVMTDMFTNAKSPFYESTHCIYLGKIEHDKYVRFIKKLFAMGKFTIDDESLDFIMEWTRGHTFYTQSLCHRIFKISTGAIGLETVKKACAQLLDEGIPGFLERRNLITDKQWLFLKAVAKEGYVSQPTSGAFISKYKLGTSAAVKRIVESLVDKELLLEELSLEGKSYSVYNVFMSRWLERL